MKEINELLLPALRAQMGDWTYYVSILKFADVATRVSVAEEIHKSESLNELIQRELTGRSKEITEYLDKQEQRLFNSLVLGIYEGDPKWFELEIKSSDLLEVNQIPMNIKGTLGFLKLSGHEKIFAIDGQHRVMAIRESIEAKSDFVNEEISIILVAHRNTEEGLVRTRRLFTTLNRYAKPVTQMEIIALDEDDIVAIITRMLVEEHSLFKGKISLVKTKSIQITDKTSFTTITMLYDVLDIYLRNRKPTEWKKYKRIRPKGEIIDRSWKEVFNFWDVMMQYFEPIKKLMTSDIEEEIAGTYRHQNGGYLLFRPVGLKAVCQVIKELISKKEWTLEEALMDIIKVPMEISEEPWVKILWDPITKTMLPGEKNRAACVGLLKYAIGFKFSKRELENLKGRLAGLLNIEIENVKLKKYVMDNSFSIEL